MTRGPSEAERESGAGTQALDPDEFQRVAAAIEREVTAAIVGQEEAVRGALVCLIAGGHALLEGAPGLGKTSLARAFAGALELDYRRIQFTPDLMPADITGTNVLTDDGSGHVRLSFEPGPVFANVLLADEINRATPKTQSALLEAMQEATVTVASASRRLPHPFCVLATQNPVEMQGTYPLPEAQLDRFLLKLRFAFPPAAEITEIVNRTAESDDLPVKPVAGASTLLAMEALARSLPAATHVVDYASRLIVALQPDAPEAAQLVREYVRLGPSPRGAQALVLAGRVVALLDGRPNLAHEDIRAVAMMALRHRLMLSFDAERHAISPEMIVADALDRVPDEAP